MEPLYRLVTTILDPDRAPARELAALYTERWEVEISLKELKIYQGRPNVVLRSRKPDGVLQELYGFAAVHYTIRWLLHHASLEQGLDPDRLSFTSGLRAMRRKLSRPESFSPNRWPILLAEATAEILEDHNPSRLRANPRVLKRAVLGYPPKRRRHALWPQPTKAPIAAVCVI